MNANTKMKSVLSLTLASVLALSLFLYSCKKDDPSPSVTVTEATTKLLTSTSWKVQSVTVDGVDQTSLFSGLVLSFTTSSFTTTSGNPVWPASGTWSFISEEAKKIQRNDGLEVTLNEISENKLVLSLVWSKTIFGPGRNSSMKGTHTFNFVK